MLTGHTVVIIVHCALVCAQSLSYTQLFVPMDCVAHQAPVSVHGIFQARMLE